DRPRLRAVLRLPGRGGGAGRRRPGRRRLQRGERRLRRRPLRRVRARLRAARRRRRPAGRVRLRRQARPGPDAVRSLPAAALGERRARLPRRHPAGHPADDGRAPAGLRRRPARRRRPAPRHPRL
ncbi:MAG: Cytidine deaminase, partial [uncultured Friedmanniella sp.]